MLTKPTPRRKERGKLGRYEKSIVKEVKEATFERDGRCRYAKADPTHHCLGIATWAHLEEIRRARTRNWPPDERHTTRGTLWLCEEIHRMYDAGQMLIEPVGPDGADGPLTFYRRMGEG